MPATRIAVPQEAIREFCTRNRIRKLSLFGSAITERFRSDSDVDMLVEFEAGSAITYLDLARMERELSDLLGRKVDLRTPQELSPHFRDQVVAGAAIEYERK